MFKFIKKYVMFNCVKNFTKTKENAKDCIVVIQTIYIYYLSYDCIQSMNSRMSFTKYKLFTSIAARM